VERALTDSSLPREIEEKILAVVSGSTLGIDDAYEVTLELIAHFEDGMSAGRSPAELLATFGEEQTVSSLIMETKWKQALFRRDTEHVVGGDSLFRAFLQSLRHAGRRLAQSPGFTATAILSLALGIGANTAIFSLVNAVILRETPFDAPEQLVDIYINTADFPYDPFSYRTMELPARTRWSCWSMDTGGALSVEARTSSDRIFA